MNKKILTVLVLASIGALFAAPTPTGPVSRPLIAINNLCNSMTQLLPVASMLMVVVAGVIYAAGQVMGAETRARANVWATAALTGALIGVLIFAVAPGVLNAIYGQTAQVDCAYVP